MKKAAFKAPNLCENELKSPDKTGENAGLWLETEAELRGLRLTGAVRGDAQNGRFSQILWHEARLGAVPMGRAHFEDTIFRGCDLANLDARRVFASRIEILQCRATGFCAPESDWRDATFRGSNFSLCQFRHAKFERVRFQACDLRESDFQNADLRGVIFENCDLRGAQFSFAKLGNADIRTSKTEDLGVDAGALRGLIVSPLQAAQLAAILGLQVRWNDADNL